MVDIKLIKLGTDDDMVAHAVFWRPTLYFAESVRQETDDLDEFEVASFCIGNYLSFDIRRYKGHPEFTCSLYFSIDLDSNEIGENIDRVVAGFEIPKTAVAWRRGDRFVSGKVERDDRDRLREPEARIVLLKIISKCKDYTATTSYVKKKVRDYYPLSKNDMVRSRKRSNEQLWQQIVGNVISHSGSSKGPFSLGYAVKDGDNITVTKKGLGYLKRLGFSS